MWFNPTELLPKTNEHPANFASSANYTAESSKPTHVISKVSRISRPTTDEPQTEQIPVISKTSRISNPACIGNPKTANTNALDKIKSAGFTLELDGNDLVIEPFSKLSPNQLEFLRSHKAEIIQELKREQAANDKSLIDCPDNRRHCPEHPHPVKVTCGQCRHFRSLHRHGKGCGDCEIGAVNMYGYWIWSDAPRECEAYTPKNAELSHATGEGQ